jgi:hypothetical protein
LAKEYPGIAEKFQAAYHGKHGSAAHDDVDEVLLAAMTDLREDPEDPRIIRGDSVLPDFPIVESAANPYFHGAPHYVHLVDTTSTNPPQIGKLLASNVGVTNRGVAGLRFTHDPATQHHMMVAIANVSQHGTESVSLLARKEDDNQEERVIDNVLRGPGKIMLNAWTGMRMTTESEREVPHPTKDRYGSKTFTPADVDRINQRLDQCVSPSETDCLATKKLLQRQYASASRQISAPRKGNKALEKDRLMIIKITNEMAGNHALPPGRDSTPNPFLNDSSEDWDIGKVSRSCHC